MEYIHEVHNIVPRALCEEIIEKFENDPDKKLGGIVVGKTVVVGEIKKTVDLHIVNKPEWKTIYDQLECLLATGIYKYFDHLFHRPFTGVACFLRNTFSEGNIDMTGLQIQRYEVGDFFHWHVDSLSGVNRIFAFIIYLNDNDGCTEFLNGKKIKPETGKIAFFPTTWTYPHRGQELKVGTKYIITGFVVVK
tara:strand:- start:261 stop:836 length:576 start_codon:yes stop_codon:yes gene_type:complete